MGGCLCYRVEFLSSSFYMLSASMIHKCIVMYICTSHSFNWLRLVALFVEKPSVYWRGLNREREREGEGVGEGEGEREREGEGKGEEERGKGRRGRGGGGEREGEEIYVHIEWMVEMFSIIPKLQNNKRVIQTLILCSGRW